MATKMLSRIFMQILMRGPRGNGLRIPKEIWTGPGCFSKRKPKPKPKSGENIPGLVKKIRESFNKYFTYEPKPPFRDVITQDKSN